MALGFFTPSGDPNVDMETRRKIAMAIMMRGRKAFPKNLGEGIASVGQEIGDYLAERSLLEQNAAENKAGDEFKSKYTGVAPQAAVAPLETEPPPESIPPAVAAASVAPPAPPIVPASAPPPRTVRPPPQPIPPQDGTLGNRGDTVFPTQANGLVQPQSSLPPGLPPPPQQATAPPMVPPVMAQGGSPAAVPPDEESRRAVAHALLRQQMGGAPPPAPAGPPRPTVADFGQPSALAPTPQAIPAAPPAAPIRAAPPPQVAQGPQIVDPGPEPTPGRTMTDLQRQILQDLDKEPPARRAAAQKAVEPILQQEQAKIDQENAIVKRKHELWTAKTKMRDEQLYGAPKEAALTAKTLQEIEDARKPKIQKLEGDEYERNPQTGVYEPVRTSDAQTGARPKAKLTGEQQKALTFHGWTSLAEEQMRGREGLLAEGIAQELVGKVPFVGNKLQAAEYRQVRGAAERFVQGFLRDISGAVVGPEEIAKHMNSFMPKPGDKPGDIADKRAAREQIITGLYSAAGTGGQKIADFDKNERTQKQVEKAATLNREMEGKDKSKTYEKGGVHRRFNGRYWEEF